MKVHLFVLILLVIVSSILGYYIGYTQGFRIVFGSLYSLFLPGYFLSYVFFKGKKIDWLERITLSFAISIAVVALLVYFSNIAGLEVTAWSVSSIIFGIIILSFFLLYLELVVKK